MQLTSVTFSTEPSRNGGAGRGAVPSFIHWACCLEALFAFSLHFQLLRCSRLQFDCRRLSNKEKILLWMSCRQGVGSGLGGGDGAGGGESYTCACLLEPRRMSVCVCV